MASGNRSASRWGLQGCEDIGGGTAAIFTLENGFSSNSGALSQRGVDMFGRKASVGLQSKTLGTFTLGCQYDMI